MKRNVLYPLVVACVVLVTLGVSGCAKKKAVEPQAMQEQVATGPEEPLETKDPSAIMEGRTSGPMLPVYFDFDKSDIRGDQQERIDSNADFLKKHQNVNIRIEGNCDPRGTNEYNLALGERRAQGARKALGASGVADDRLNTVSWGEEKLLLFGHDELSWAQNRRDDFVIVE